MDEAIDEATLVVRKCLENPRYDSVGLYLILIWSKNVTLMYQITRVIFVVFSEKDEKKYRDRISHQFPPADDSEAEIDDKEGEVKGNEERMDDKTDYKTDDNKDEVKEGKHDKEAEYK